MSSHSLLRLRRYALLFYRLSLSCWLIVMLRGESILSLNVAILCIGITGFLHRRILFSRRFLRRFRGLKR